MATASIAVEAGRPGEDSITEWVGVIAFGSAGETLCRHTKGDLINVMGPLTKSTFTGRDGQERSGWSLAVESILSARTVRPGGARKTINQSHKRQAYRNNGVGLPNDRVDDLWPMQ
jgi:single-stranded DNA-binding protein